MPSQYTENQKDFMKFIALVFAIPAIFLPLVALFSILLGKILQKIICIFTVGTNENQHSDPPEPPDSSSSSSRESRNLTSSDPDYIKKYDLPIDF